MAAAKKATARSLGAGVDEVVPYPRGKDKNATGADRVSAPIFHLQLAVSSDDILGLLGRIGVPAKTPSRLDLIDDRRRLSRACPP